MSDYEGIEWFLHWFGPPSASILDYVPSDTLIIWDDLLPPDRRLDECIQNYARHLERVPDIFLPYVSPPDKLLAPIEEVTQAMTCSKSRLVIAGSSTERLKDFFIVTCLMVMGSPLRKIYLKYLKQSMEKNELSLIGNLKR